MTCSSNGIGDDPTPQLVGESGGEEPQHGEIQSECSSAGIGDIMGFPPTRCEADVGPTASDAESAEDDPNTKNNPTGLIRCTVCFKPP